MKKALALVVLAAAGLTSGCGNVESGEGVPEVTSSDAATLNARDAEMAPTDTPLGIAPSSPEGEATEVVPGLVLTLPEGATIHDPGTAEGVEEVVTYRMPDAVGGLPALQIKTAQGVDIFSETWVHEKAFSINAVYDDVHRSVETWPGADRAIAFNWSEDLPLDTGEVLPTEVASLWLVTQDGQFYSVMAVAAAGELEDSAVLAAMLSAELVGS